MNHLQARKKLCKKISTFKPIALPFPEGVDVDQIHALHPGIPLRVEFLMKLIVGIP